MVKVLALWLGLLAYYANWASERRNAWPWISGPRVGWSEDTPPHFDQFPRPLMIFAEEPVINNFVTIGDELLEDYEHTLTRVFELFPESDVFDGRRDDMLFHGPPEN